MHRCINYIIDLIYQAIYETGKKDRNQELDTLQQQNIRLEAKKH